MRAFSGYKPEVKSAFEQIPAGAYICKILNAEQTRAPWGADQLELSIDIVEGEYTGFFEKDYAAQTREDKWWRGIYRINIPTDDGSEKDEWDKNTFNRVIGVIEDANPDFHFDWDEKKLKGKIIGLLFREEEKQGKNSENTYWNINPFKAVAVGDIKDGKDFKINKKPLKNKAAATAIPGFQEEPYAGKFPWD